MHTEKKILVVGGAGFIGSHMVQCLHESGFTPIVLDNLSTGHESSIINAELIIGDMSDSALLETIFSNHQILAVMHFAAYIQVGESVENPQKYYQNNVVATLNLLNVMLKFKVKHFIFSSTAAVYGEPEYSPIDEEHRRLPINPYGASKWMVEQILQDYAKAYDFHFAALRYFNAAGAGHTCERHDPETHLIPLILQVAKGERDAIHVFGSDYPTRDGTCIRDYIHVLDLCRAHLLALNKIINEKKSLRCNLGTGHGYSVLEVIKMVETITQKNISIKNSPRRSGDPAELVADAKFAKQELQWQPIHSDIETIIRDAWKMCVEK